MGAKPNYRVGHHGRFLCIDVAAGEAAYHKGAQFGVAHGAEASDGDMAKFAASLDTFGAFAEAVAICFAIRKGEKTMTDLDAFMATQTGTSTTAPFGGSLADFWDGLSSVEKDGGTVDGVVHRGFVTAILIAAADCRISS